MQGSTNIDTDMAGWRLDFQARCASFDPDLSLFYCVSQSRLFARVVHSSVWKETNDSDLIL